MAPRGVELHALPHCLLERLQRRSSWQNPLPFLRSYARVWLARFSGVSPPPPPLANFRSAGPADVSPSSSDVSGDWCDWLRQLYAQTPRPPQMLDTCTNPALPAVVDVAAIPGIMLSDVPPSAVDCESPIVERILVRFVWSTEFGRCHAELH